MFPSVGMENLVMHPCCSCYLSVLDYRLGSPSPLLPDWEIANPACSPAWQFRLDIELSALPGLRATPTVWIMLLVALSCSANCY
jgi:hypothetical protein